MDTASSKRKRSDEPSAADEDCGDSVIGLDVGGQLFYTHRSTLTAGSAYFAARFGGTFSAGESYEDERGRKVYFVDAEAKLFDHILAYLRRGMASWPDLAEDPKFYKRLVAEAEFFGVEAMLRELQDSASIAPNASGRGILYWLGTRKGEEDYMNPYMRNKLRVEPLSVPNQTYATQMISNLSDFFEYRPSCNSRLQSNCHMLWCGCPDGAYRPFSFVDMVVKPTHYSLRFGNCHGMSDWNFEASVDGIGWDILHEARKERCILQPSREEIDNLPDDDDFDYVAIAEDRHRHTWKVSSSSFYKYFRFVTLTKEQRQALYGGDEGGYRNFGPDGRILFSKCLHGVGLELYGNVKSAK